LAKAAVSKPEVFKQLQIVVEKRNFVLKGDIGYSGDSRSLKTFENSFLVCSEGRSAGVFPRLPRNYADFPLIDYTGKLILPGLTDLHTHAPQFAFRGIGMDRELLDWLESCAFPEEAKYRDAGYARRVYGALVEHLTRGPNTRLCIFATIHVPAVMILMDLLEDSGLVSFVGKLNMDRNCPEDLREKDAESSAASTREWLSLCAARSYRNTYPILSPRFIPSCSDALMSSLGILAARQGLPVQSHLSENRKEIAWVAELCPEAENYGAAYRDFGLFGGDIPTVMAHCVWSPEEELALIRERGVHIAHCPQSNTNLASGIAPVRRFLDLGIPVGLGSDVAGGVHTSIFRAMTDAIQVSKLRQRLVAENERALSLEEAFYLGTAGGGSFFRKATGKSCGSFEAGNEFDALVIDEAPRLSASLGVRDRIERAVYLSGDRPVLAKWVRGKRIV
jgi:guanine deaminase